jgi:uncharacterized protein
MTKVKLIQESKTGKSTDARSFQNKLTEKIQEAKNINFVRKNHFISQLGKQTKNMNENNIRPVKTAIIVLLVFLSLKSLAQNSEDLKRFENLFGNSSPEHKWMDELKDNKNELTFIFSATFVLYKELLSSQDVDACVFTPSCSVYAIESIKQKGVIVGFLNAIDRLTRCNPGPKKDMPIDLSTGKYSDPVEHSRTGHRKNKFHYGSSISDNK